MTDPIVSFVFIDLTTDTTPASMRPAGSFNPIIDALIEQVNDFNSYYGGPCVAFRVGASATDRQPNEIGVNFRDNIPEAPGALAFHQVVNGIPDIEIGVDLFMGLTSGDESMSSGVSHELLETLLDPGCNLWADLGTGTMRAKEACDTVQNKSYLASNGVALSDWLLPHAWIPGSLAPWNKLGSMQSIDDYSAGYEDQAPAPTNVSQVSGMRAERKQHERVGLEHLSELAKKRKAHPYSRASRRMHLLNGGASTPATAAPASA